MHRHRPTTAARIGLGTLIVGMVLSLMAFGVPSAGAAVEPQIAGSSEALIAAALDRIEAGSWTRADLDLLRQYPDVAAQVPDPSQPPELMSVSSSGGTVSKGAAAGAVASLTTICGAWVDAWFQKKSILGNSIYKWHHYVRYCRNGNVVTSWQTRYDYVTDQQTGVYVREQTVNSQWGLGTNNATSHIQRHLEFCILKLGCYENHYPWSKVTVHGNGTYDWTGSTG